MCTYNRIIPPSLVKMNTIMTTSHHNQHQPTQATNDITAKFMFYHEVCAQFPMSAVNVALLTFAAAHHAAALCCCGTGRAAINQYPLPTRPGPTAANLLHVAAAGKRDRRMDTVPSYRPCSAFYVDSANNPVLQHSNDSLLYLHCTVHASQCTAARTQCQSRAHTHIHTPV